MSPTDITSRQAEAFYRGEPITSVLARSIAAGSFVTIP